MTLVGPDVGGNDVVGIYRVDGPSEFTVIADIGQFALKTTEHAVRCPDRIAIRAGAVSRWVPGYGWPSNRLLHVTRDGAVSELRAFGNIVPTGLAVSGNRVYMAEAGAVPHLPQDGKIVVFEPQSPTVTGVATGARLLVDVELAAVAHSTRFRRECFPPAIAPGLPRYRTPAPLYRRTKMERST